LSAGFWTRGRADRFAALVDGDPTQARPAELADLVALAAQLRAVPEVAPRPDFAASLRERLMAEAPAALALAEPADAASERLTVARRAPSKTSRERRIGVAVAAFSIVGATAASAVASQGALPGDTLYPVKRLIEDAKTSLAMGDQAKASALLAQARTRLEEARDLGRRGNADPAEITQALRDFRDTARDASTIVLAEYADHGSRREIDRLRSFAQQSVTTLSELTAVLPDSVHGALADAVRTLLQIDRSAAEACPSCDGAGITELPSTLIDLLSSTSDVAGPMPSATPQATGGRIGPKGPIASSGPSQAPGGPLSGLTDPLSNAGPAGGSGTSTTKPSSGPTSVGGAVGDLGGTVGGTLDGVGGTVGNLGDQVGGTVGDVVGGVGGTVGDVGGAVGGTTGTVGNTLDGLLGGLLSPTQTPTP
jgi:hypothetical protein